MNARSIAPRPDPRDLDRLLAAGAPFARLAAPYFEGLERIPETRPLLFVGNHTLYGVLDVPFLFGELWRSRRIFPRALGDHVHFAVPGWRELLTRLGVVDGTRENCAALMRAGEAILVFPGGAREVGKRKGEHYRLQWKERLGFARLAAAHGCTIVPFSAVGADDCYDIVLDGDDFLRTPLGRAARRLGLREDAMMPLARGAFGTPLPRPERFYFHFGQPIAVEADPRDEAAVRAVRDRTRTAVEDGLARMLAVRAADPDRPLHRRLLRALRPAVSSS